MITKSSLLRPLALAGALGLSASFAHSQLLTASTLSGFDATSAYNFGFDLHDSFSFTQTFSGISSITDLSFRFMTTDSSVFSSTDLTVFLSEWSGINSTGALVGQTTVNIADSSSWTITGSGFNYFDGELDLSSFATALTPATTYGLSIFGNATSTNNFRLGVDVGNTYAAGNPFLHISSLTSGGIGLNNDFLFQGAVSPVPEASSIAVLFAGAFVGGMMLRRSRYRRHTLLDTAAGA